MRAVWKFDVGHGANIWLVPRGAQFLTVQAQRGGASAWFLVDMDAPPEPRSFYVVGTGQELPPLANTYRGTFQLVNGDLVLHAFEWAP